MYKTFEEIIQIIKNNKILIFNNLEKESIEVYRFLINRFDVTDDITTDEVYKFVYRSFYKIDNAGLTKQFKNEYFEILQEYRIIKEYSDETITAIANRLHKFKTLKNTDSFQFSFISKMLNTINVHSPIWDSEVRLVFKFPDIKSKLPLDEKITMAIKHLSYMKGVYKQIEESNELNDIIVEFDEKYKTVELSFNKKIDFILWSTGKVLKTPKEKKKKRKQD
jgi:hypothetical protein